MHKWHWSASGIANPQSVIMRLVHSLPIPASSYKAVHIDLILTETCELLEPIIAGAGYVVD